jgi:hypothetical protein
VPDFPDHRPPTDRIPAAGLELRLADYQAQIIDWLALAQARHAMHSLLEVEVTRARAAIRGFRARTGRPLSFNAYVTGCFARAIAADPRIAAMRHGRRRLLVFAEVDVALPVESEVEGEPIPVPHIVRRADGKPLDVISEEITADVRGPVPYAWARRLMGAWLLLPAWLRRRLLGLILADARRRKRLTGTVLVTAVGLPGKGPAWGLPNGTSHPVALVIGGIRRDEQGREQVALTVTFDHDTVNGAPAARFLRRFVRLVESGELVTDYPR